MEEKFQEIRIFLNDLAVATCQMRLISSQNAKTYLDRALECQHEMNKNRKCYLEFALCLKNMVYPDNTALDEGEKIENEYQGHYEIFQWIIEVCRGKIEEQELYTEEKRWAIHTKSIIMAISCTKLESFNEISQVEQEIYRKREHLSERINKCAQLMRTEPSSVKMHKAIECLRAHLHKKEICITAICQQNQMKKVYLRAIRLQKRQWKLT